MENMLDMCNELIQNKNLKQIKMNKYLNVLNQSKQILEGFKNRIFKQEHIEAEAGLRMDICNTCNHLDLKGSECLVPGTQPCCASCGCSLSLKLITIFRMSIGKMASSDD